MTETKNTGEKTLSVPGKTLSLKRSSVEQGMVRQSFSHGRSKAVVVEKVKRRPGPGARRADCPAAAIDHTLRPRAAALRRAEARSAGRSSRGERRRSAHIDGRGARGPRPRARRLPFARGGGSPPS